MLTDDQLKHLSPGVALTVLRIERAFAGPRNQPTKANHASAYGTLAQGEWRAILALVLGPVRMILHCPACHEQHVDAPEPTRGWTNPPHRSHLCHACGYVWRPADVPTTGVRAIATAGEHDTRPSLRPPTEATKS